MKPFLYEELLWRQVPSASIADGVLCSCCSGLPFTRDGHVTQTLNSDSLSRTEMGKQPRKETGIPKTNSMFLKQRVECDV